MKLFLLPIIMVASFWVLANLRASYTALPITFVVVLAGILIFSGISLFFLVTSLFIALIIIVTGLSKLRKRLISNPLLKQFRQVLPPMSQTEQEALKAGTVWWDAQLFSGKPKWDRLLSLPSPSLTEEEQAFIDGPVETLCQMLDDWQITHEEKDLPEEVWAFIRESGILGMIIPKAYGGQGFSALAHSAVLIKLASRSVTASVTVMVPNSLGPGKLLLHYGTEEQKNYYLPRLASGQEIPCFALTGPKAGSDAGAIPDLGVVCHGEYKGEEILGVRLNWEKRYITLGPVATLIGLAFKLEDPDKLLGEHVATGITVALIPTDTPGIEIGERHIPLDIPFQNGPNSGRDVFIPIEWIVGGYAGIGKGWRMLVESLAVGRGISLPALATGAGKTACRYTGAYARIRKQFNLPVGYFEGVEEALARIAGFTYRMDAARLLTLQGIDLGERPSVISALVKYNLTESFRQAVNDAMDVQGGNGICLGPQNIIGRIYQSIPIAITVEGANILTRSMIIFGQGAIRCHPYVLKELEAAYEKDEQQALEKFDQVLVRHIAHLIGNFARSFILGLLRGRFLRSPVSGPSRRYFQQLNWMSTAFALFSDLAMITLGGALKRKEHLSARLADILSELYITSAVLMHFQNQGNQEEDLPLVQWSCEHGLYQIQEAFRSLFRNLPYRSLAWLMRIVIFPTGMPYSPPLDSVGHEVARIILSPSDSRDRLTHGIYISRNTDEQIGLLELGIEQAELVAQTEAAIQSAYKNGLISGDTQEQQLQIALSEGIINEDDMIQMELMESLRNSIVAVDAFSEYGKKEKKGISTYWILKNLSLRSHHKRKGPLINAG